MSTTADLLDALRTHLAAFEVPTLFSVRLSPSTEEPRVSAQLDCDPPAQIAADLLAWADTLTGITTTAWRVPDGKYLHLSITGRLTDGALIEVYGGMPFTGSGIGADLTPQSRTTVPLAALRALATLGEVPL